MKKYFYIFILFLIPVTVFGNYQISARGKEHIKSYEKCVLNSYWDSNGYSIGYGHHGSDVKKNMVISKKQADAYFNKDIEWINKSINRLINNLPVKHNFSQGFIDGLGDLLYNCGEGNIKNSTFYKRLLRCRKNNKQDMDYTISAVKTTYIKYKGNIKRRETTYKMMVMGM